LENKTVDERFRDDLNVLVTIMRSQVIASHVIIMEEIRDLQGKPFDCTVEVNRLEEHRKVLAEHFNLQYDALVRVLEKRRKSPEK